MNCRAAKDLLPLHAGHDLPLAQASRLERHLQDCPECVVEMSAYREARQALVAARDEDVQSSGIWQAIAPRLDAADARRALLRPWYRRPAAIASLAAALLAVGLLPFVLPKESPVPGGSNLSDFVVSNPDLVGSMTPVSRKDVIEFLSKVSAMPLKMRANEVLDPNEDSRLQATPVRY